MKIVLDARFYGVENTGIGRYVMNLVTELAKLDKENSYTILLLEKYAKKLKLPAKWKKVVVNARHYSLKEQLELPKILNQENPDVVHFPHFNVPGLWRGTFVVTIHDILMHKQKGKEATTLPFIKYKLKRVGYKSIFKQAVMKSRKIIVPTNFVKSELVKHYAVPDDKLVVTYEGVDDLTATSQISAKTVFKKFAIEDNYFVYTGNAYPHKNLSRAIEAIVALNATTTEKIMFYIVCSRSVFTKRLEEEIARQQAGEYVKLLGYVPDDELALLYSHALGFLYPSLYEGFGLPGLEAMSQGTLALVSDIPVFREVYKDSAFYFNPYDFSSIKNTLRSVVDLERSKRLQKIKEAKKFLSRYSWKNMAKETLKIYNGAHSENGNSI